MNLDPEKKLFARYLRRNSTNVEKLLWLKLRNRQFLGIKFRRQQSIEGFIVDFVSLEKKLIIEIDGGQHNQRKNILKDQKRTRVLENNGFTVLRFWNNEVLQNLDGVLEALTLALSQGERGKVKLFT